MKTIFRYANVGLLTAALFAVGALSAIAQAPCEDADGQVKLDGEFRAALALTGIENKKKAVELGKQFLEKYGSCEPTAQMSEYLKKTIPLLEKQVKDGEVAKERGALLIRFDAAMKTKNWNEVYGAGKEIYAKWPDEFRDVVLVLGSVGLDETAKATPVTTWNEETLRFARQAISELEANKTFKNYGVSIAGGANFDYKNKEDALGWMNYTIGYILFVDRKDKKNGLAHLYKATQINSDTKSNPVIYQTIGSYYFDEVRRLAKEVTELEKTQDTAATPEAQKALVDQIKAKVAMVNGTAEAAIDAYARARDLANKSTTVSKEYKDSLTKTLSDLYNVRFGKMDGFDTFVANTLKKPMPNPLDPITPISDPEPTVTTTTTSATPAADSKPAAPIKPAAAPATKPAAGKVGAKTVGNRN